MLVNGGVPARDCDVQLWYTGGKDTALGRSNYESL